MRRMTIIRTITILAILFPYTLCAQSGAQTRALYFSFFYAPPPTGVMKAAPVYQGFARSDDRGESWSNLGWLTSAVSGFAVDANSPNRIVLASDYGVLASLNGGTDWKLISEWNMPPVLVVRLRGAEIWAATARGVFVSSDHGGQWTARSVGLPQPDGSYVSDIQFTSDALIAATADGVFRSTDAGKSWFRSGLNGEAVFRLVVHPGNASIIAAINQEKGVWVSTDGGRLWDDRSATLPSKRVKCAAFDPRSDGAILVGTVDMGVMRSADLGRKWELSSGGLTNFNITSLLFDPDMPDRVYAGAENGSFISNNRGKTWQAFSVRLGYVSAMEMH
ncbi:MAG: hypothetical protein IH600_15195 [Bacteroidetes bacterium]|nr:hypothetical protein [Bacteroidota bacterium]